METHSLSEHHRNDLTDSHSKVESTAIKHKHPMLATLLLSEVKNLGLSSPSVLEAGCESGWFAERLQELGANYTGLDASADRFYGAAQAVPSARFVEGDVLDWESGGARFDLVLSVEQLAMCVDHGATVRRLAQLVAPRGYLVISTENPFVYDRMSWMNKPLLPGEVRNRISKKRLCSLLRDNDLTVVKTFTFLPMGTDGILWWVNAEGINRAVRVLLPAAALQRLKERCGLGQFQIVIAQRA